MLSPMDDLVVRFHCFDCTEAYADIKDTAEKLTTGGFYWGSLSPRDAARLLQDAAPGRFLVRDSTQRDVYFTLTYRSVISVVSRRIIYERGRFRMQGNGSDFASLFGLLEHYVANVPLSLPFRTRAPTLKELCRRSIVDACGGREQQRSDRLKRLPLPPALLNFLVEFPYML